MKRSFNETVTVLRIWLQLSFALQTCEDPESGEGWPQIYFFNMAVSCETSLNEDYLFHQSAVVPTFHTNLGVSIAQFGVCSLVCESTRQEWLSLAQGFAQDLEILQFSKRRHCCGENEEEEVRS